MKGKQIRLVLLSVMMMAILTACSNNKEKEEIVEEKVVTIADKTFSKGDLEFYTLMKKIQIEINRHFDMASYDGEDLEKRTVFWDDQLNYNENINVQLQNLIEIYAMSLLAEEKNYYIPQEKLDKEIDSFKEGVATIDGAKQLIENYGEGKFNRNLQDYMRQSMLRDRVVTDLEKEIKEEKPQISKDELNFNLSEKYEELYMDQIGDLIIQVHVK